MIAEPWDIGPNGYQLGNFPKGWGEWNDQFRDTTRQFWLSSDKPSVTRAAFAMRLCGSADTFQKDRRTASDSVNFIVAHDGFTLRDLVSYEQRHNHANGENNRDGHGHNCSINCGIEGPTDDENIVAMRSRLQRVLIATTLLSLGTPMLCAGDELGHSQNGNNNPYCQDNEITWIDWETWKTRDEGLTKFTAYVIALRNRFNPLGTNWGDVSLAWVTPTGDSMTDKDWHSDEDHCFACIINPILNKNPSALLIFNPSKNSREFNIPSGSWQAILDTSLTSGHSLPLATHNNSVLVSSNCLMFLVVCGGS
jgi:glycogen debranching enzyme GlgX